MFSSNLLKRPVRIALLALAGSATSAWAQVPLSSLSMTFVEPTAVVAPTDSIDMVVRLTNNDASQSFIVDGSLPNLGLDASLLPTQGTYDNPQGGDPIAADFISYTGGFLGLAYGCSGSISDNCGGGPPYSFTFADGHELTQPFSLAAGAHLDILFGTFAPSAGAVAAGTYEFYRAPLALWVFGTDVDGHSLSSLTFQITTCEFDNASDCAASGIFSRTVSAVPETGTYALMVLGLAALGLKLRRSRRLSR